MDQVGDVCRCDCHITYLDNTVKKDCYCSCNGLKIIRYKRMSKMEIKVKLEQYNENKPAPLYLSIDENTPENYIDIILNDNNTTIRIEDIKLALKKITAKLG